jgi:hypothetical protein
MNHHSQDRGAVRSLITLVMRGLLLLGIAWSLTGCLHAIQETTCKTKFKKKYNCKMKDIHIVENEGVIGDQIRLRGCGKTVTYDGTKEVLVED